MEGLLLGKAYLKYGAKVHSKGFLKVYMQNHQAKFCIFMLTKDVTCMTSNHANTLLSLKFESKKYNDELK